MNMRERLIEIINSIDVMKMPTDNFREHLADHLIQNGVIAPPCKVGDKVYSIVLGKISELTVLSISMLKSSCVNSFQFHCRNYRDAIISYSLNDFEECVFLTCEEAEKALERNKQ